MHKAITIQIGNSDNKLTQAEWSAFCRDTNAWVIAHAAEVHFYGHSPGEAPWQNAAWVFCPRTGISESGALFELRRVCARYRQTSIAATPGETKFIEP